MIKNLPLYSLSRRTLDVRLRGLLTAWLCCCYKYRTAVDEWDAKCNTNKAPSYFLQPTCLRSCCCASSLKMVPGMYVWRKLMSNLPVSSR